MKKKTNIVLTLLTCLFAFAACTPEVDDVFDSNASDRIETSMADLKKVITASPNGWRLEYYGNPSYGGFNVLMKFDENTVTVASEKAHDNHKAGFDEAGNLITATSHYSISQSQGVILGLDEYNEVFHYFSDPSYEDFGLKGDGFEGDLEFRIISACADSVIMRGKKHNSTVKMYPMPADKEWSTYLHEVEATYNWMASRSYTLENDELKGEDGENLVLSSVTTTHRCMNFLHYDDEGVVVVTQLPFIILPDGYKMYKPTTVCGIEIGFIEKQRGDESTQEHFYIKGQPNTTKIYSYLPTLFEALKDGQWYFTYEDNAIGDFAKPYWDTFRDEGLEELNVDMYYAYIGSYSSDKTCLYMYTDGDVRLGLTFKQEETEDASKAGSRVTIKYSSTLSNKKGKNYFEKNKGDELLYPICNGTKGRTFDIVTDSRRNPTYLELHDISEPTNIIKVFKDRKNYPYGVKEKD